MKQVILDTSFILTCVKQKIDFFEILEDFGLTIIIPNEVINEVRGINNAEAKTALVILEKNVFKKVNLNTKNVDKGLIDFAKKHEEILIATLDKEIKDKIKHGLVVIRGKKKIEII